MGDANAPSALGALKFTPTMKYFASSIIHPYALERGYRRFCEVGASYGENTDRLLELHATHVTIVDPCLDTDLAQKYAGITAVNVEKGLSLDVLKGLRGEFDCILIDGDHNWYTVFNELRLIAANDLLRPGGTIFLHDVGHPYGRRDMYYQPATIPPEFLHPYAQKGIVRGQTLLSETGEGMNAIRDNAVHAGGPRNGVLTAVKDFAAQHPGEYWFVATFDQYGLGILYRRDGTLQGDWLFARWWGQLTLKRVRDILRTRKGKFLAVTLALALLSIVIPSRRTRR